jgi:hypothetical protein
MKKWSFLIGIAMVVAIAGSAFALRINSDDKTLPVTAQTETVAVNSQGEPTSQAAAYSGCGSGGCGSSAGGSGGCGSGAAPTQAQIERIRSYLYDFYAKNLGDPSIEVDVQNLGCHQEATVTQAGKVIKRLSINGDRITDIT